MEQTNRTKQKVCLGCTSEYKYSIEYNSWRQPRRNLFKTLFYFRFWFLFRFCFLLNFEPEIDLNDWDNAEVSM